jgi:hypothetical protein
MEIQLRCPSVFAVGTGPVLRALAAELEVSPWGLLPAFPPAPLPAPLRAAAVHALKASIKARPAPGCMQRRPAAVCMAQRFCYVLPCAYRSQPHAAACWESSRESTKPGSDDTGNELGCPGDISCLLLFPPGFLKRLQTAALQTMGSTIHRTARRCMACCCVTPA